MISPPAARKRSRRAGSAKDVGVACLLSGAGSNRTVLSRRPMTNRRRKCEIRALLRGKRDDAERTGNAICEAYGDTCSGGRSWYCAFFPLAVDTLLHGRGTNTELFRCSPALLSGRLG